MGNTQLSYCEQQQQSRSPQQPSEAEKKPRFSLKLMKEEEYVALNKTVQIDRERNLLLLMKLRPGVFAPEEQKRAEEINYEIKKTSVLILAGFLANSGFRVWQIKNQNKNVTLAISVILLAYLPAFTFYQYQHNIQTQFIREISARYQTSIDDTSLKNFIDSQQTQQSNKSV